MEEDQKICGIQVKNKRLFYLGVFAGALSFMTVLIIAIAGSNYHPATAVFYTLIGVLGFFVVLLVLAELNCCDRSLPTFGSKKSADLATMDATDDAVMANSEIPYTVDVLPCPGEPNEGYFEGDSDSSHTDDDDDEMTVSVDIAPSTK